MALGIPAGLLVAKIAHIPLTYPVAPQHKLPLLLPLYLVTPGAVEVHRRLTDSSWSDYGLGWGKTFLIPAGSGFAIAAGGVVLLVALQVGWGWRQWRSAAQETGQPEPVVFVPSDLDSPPPLATPPGNSPPPGLVLPAVLTLALFVGWVEELVFRGVLVNGLGEALPLWTTAIAASLIFAVSHLLWDGPAGAPQLPGLATMGAVLLLARWVDGGSLGLAWGLHAGWVFAIAAIDALALVQPGQSKPVWLVGLFDQPLTGVLPLGLLLLTGAGLWIFG